MNIIERLRRKGVKVDSDEDLLIEAHHQLMKFYHCWISIDELKKIPIPTMQSLLERIAREKKKPEPIPVIVMGYAKKSGGKRLGG